jgi:uncharacterized protein
VAASFAGKYFQYELLMTKKVYWILGIAILIVVAVVVLVWLLPHSKCKGLCSQDTILLRGKEFDVFVADTEQKRVRGLSGVEILEANDGMFFVFQKNDLWGIWMKEMKIPIDIIWLDENMRVVHIEEKVSPESFPKVFTPSQFARYVLEVSSGTVERVGIKVGDEAKYEK